MSYPQQPPYPPQPQDFGPQMRPPQKPKKTKKWPFVVGGIVLLFVIIGVSNGGKSATSTTTTAAPAPSVPAVNSQPVREQPVAPPAPAEPAAPSKDQITYEVTGQGVSKANNITYVKDQKFGQQQENSSKLPWKKTIEFDNGMFDYQPMSLVAQSGSGGSGSITCRILKNGEELTSSTSSGPYAVVTCSG